MSVGVVDEAQPGKGSLGGGRVLGRAEEKGLVKRKHLIDGVARGLVTARPS